MTRLPSLPALAATFDFGQTLAELDTAFLSRRLGERGLDVPAEALDPNIAAAWRIYDEAIARGEGGHPWKTLMRALLERSGVAGSAAADAADWLWTEQPKRNLWRRPIAGMIEIVRSLRSRGVPVAALSNSEGRLAELVAELGWSDALPIVADSGALGMEKPARPIFAWTADRLGVPLERIVHVGDSLAADVEGALAAGMRAIWFRGRSKLADDRVRTCQTAAEVAMALVRWGL